MDLEKTEKQKRSNIKLAVYYFSLLIFFQVIGILFIVKILKTNLTWGIVLTVFIALILPVLLGFFLIKLIKKSTEEGGNCYID